MARPARLSRDKILAMAVRLADRDGLESVTMRRLGQALGVEAMSLYKHVKNKNDIFDGLLERVLSEVDLPQPGPDWETELRRTARSMHDALARHPWACTLVMAPASSPKALESRIRYIEALLRTLREAGFTPAQAYYGYHALDSHAVGFTMWELGHAVPDDAVVEQVTRQIEHGAYPYLLEHARQHEADHPQSSFEFGLDLIFDRLRGLMRSDRRGVGRRR
jgi:AcrR family transcriptional regulator